MKTLGEMISELEDDLLAIRAGDKFIRDWRFRFEAANESRKKILLKEILSFCGFSRKEIKNMLTPSNIKSHE